jgi:hypothetical protein
MARYIKHTYIQGVASMGTRGVYGFKLNGNLKVTYNHMDSYLTGLGLNICGFIKYTSIPEMIEIYNYIQLVGGSSNPTKDQINKCTEIGLLDDKVGSKSNTDWYCLLRNTQGSLTPYKHRNVPWMIDSSSFLKDSVFCEFAYVINLDTEILEIFSYGHLYLSIPLQDIKNSTEKDMERFFKLEEKRRSKEE